MMSSAVSVAPAALSESQRTALISLLADEDPSVYGMVRGKLVAYGSLALGWLQPYALADDPLLRVRVRSLISFLRRQTTDNEFLAFCLNSRNDLDLEEACGFLCRTRYPEVNWDGYEALLDQFAHDVTVKAGPASAPGDTLSLLSEHLFQTLSFRGNEKYESDAANAYLNHILDRRTGNPIGLSTVFMLVARRLRLPVTGIGLPGHFICRYQSPTQEVYIDAFNQGRLLTKADCIRFLLQTNYSLHEGYLTPVSPRRMLLRMCANLQQTYLQAENLEEASRIKRYLVALST